MGYYRFGVKLAFIFFLLSTAILILFSITLSTKIALLAYQFTITAILINWLYAAMLLFYLLKKKITLNTLFKTLGVMLINIPVGIVYSRVMVFLLSFARVTFSNSTGEDLGPIRVEGCEQKEIDELKNGAEKTIWIKIPRECNIEIQYEFHGVTKKEMVAGYLKINRGAKLKYDIKQ